MIYHFSKPFFFAGLLDSAASLPVLTVSKLALKWIPSHETDSLRAGDGSRLIPAAAGYGQTGQSGRVRIFFCSAGEQKLGLDVDGRNRRTLGGLVAG